MQTSRQPRLRRVWISGETLNGMFHIASQIISTSQRNSKIKFEKLVLSCQSVLYSTVYGTSVIDSHVFMFDMTGSKSCKLLKKTGFLKQKEGAKYKVCYHPFPLEAF